MEKIKIGELNKDTLINAMETCKKTTVCLRKLINKEVLSDEIEDEFYYIFDGLWKLIFVLYPIETLEQDKLDKLYTIFQNYLEDDTKSVDEFLKIIEEK